MNNKLHDQVQKLKVDPELEADLFSWLAWGSMGTGLLADWRCFPMARYDDDVLSYLRNGTFRDHIIRIDRLSNGVFAGEKDKINEAIANVVGQANRETKAKSIIDAVPADVFETRSPGAFALYSSNAITSMYPAVGEKIVSEPALGRTALVQLINSHLHQTFQDSFPEGVAVLRPFPRQTTALVEPNLFLAKKLVECAYSPLPPTCPPNRPGCEPCDTGKKMPITQPPAYRNSSLIFTIGTVPHPYTLTSLLMGSDQVTASYVRRDTERDPWLTEVTKDLLGKQWGGPSRVVVLKDMVAGDAGVCSSLWMTVESLLAEPGVGLPSTLLDELEWQFGFLIPRDPEEAAKADKKKKGNNDSKKNAKETEHKDSVQGEYDLITKARELLQSDQPDDVSIKNVTEAWHLADTEAWRFIRAYRLVLPVTRLNLVLTIWFLMISGRRVVERKKWEEEEKNFVT